MRLQSRTWVAAILLTAGAFVFAQSDQPPPEGQQPGDKKKSVLEMEGHQLGDQTLALSAGMMVPLFFQEFGGSAFPTNLTLGGMGELQWAAYLNPNLRIGLDLAGSFARSPNDHTLFLMPITAKVAYVLGVSRFEFPFYLGAGISIVRYREWSHVDFILKPGVAGYWRYDSNWSFGLNLTWWLDFQSTTSSQDPSQARMGNFLMISPSVFYNF